MHDIHGKGRRLQAHGYHRLAKAEKLSPVAIRAKSQISGLEEKARRLKACMHTYT